MDLDDTPEQATYRARARTWLQEHRDHAPGRTGSLDDPEYLEARRVWQRELVSAGLAGITWPTEYGGQGLGPLEQVAANQEIARAGVPGILDTMGVGALGPGVIAHGSQAQCDRYLRPLLYADEVWAELFSEPAAGSDLAAVRTRARPSEDGGWTLNGQKVWTTNAQFATFGLVLARTDPDVPKHQGLSMFIVPMDAPGVSVRPLRLISGESEFNEVFLDDVALDADTIVGSPGGGWRAALTVLMFERLTIGFGTRFAAGEALAGVIAGDADAAADADVRQRLGQIVTELTAIRFNGYRAMTRLARGDTPGPEAGLAKITMVNATAAAADVATDILGPDALADGGEWAYITSFLPGLKSAGGSEAILANTIGERVLGLPPEPRQDKGIPFSEMAARKAAEVAA